MSMRYDPVHDMDNSVPELSSAIKTEPIVESAPDPIPVQLPLPLPLPLPTPVPIAPTTDATEPGPIAKDKVSISSLLSNDEENKPVQVEETQIKTEPVPSKRVLLANKRKHKDNLSHYTGPAEAVYEPLAPAAAETADLDASADPLKRIKRLPAKVTRTPGSLSTVYRTRHLKKPDSEPLWRGDIQHDFLQLLLTNNVKFLTNPYDKIDEDIKYWSKINGDDAESSSLGYGDKLTFFQSYLITILKSNRISKILKDRLVEDLNYLFKFIILCLLVNFGRLNTTINFDYEMRSQLRTYHCIPVLQLNHDIFGIAQEPENVVENNGGGSGYTLNTVKQLQDTPRLKTILKSVSDFNHDLANDSLDSFLETCRSTNHLRNDQLKDKYNLVTLIFHISSFEDQLMDTFVKDRRYESKSTIFNETFNLNNGKPELKVNRFLWMVYLLHETDLSVEQNLSNPFGVVVGGKNEIPLLEIDYDTEYNVDTEKEMEFAEIMKMKRKNFLDIVKSLGNEEGREDDLVDDEHGNDSKNISIKFPLNRKGRKRRIIDDAVPFDLKLLPKSRTVVTTTTTSANQSQTITKLRKKPGPVAGSSRRSRRGSKGRSAPPIKSKANGAGTLKRRIVIKPKVNPKELLKEKLINKFIKEYIGLQVEQRRELRLKMGDVDYFRDYTDDQILELGYHNLYDYNEFKLKYLTTLDQLYENNVVVLERGILDDLF